MKFSQAKHFWTWFQTNSQILLHLPDMDAMEREFWMREIATHMRAYTKRLFIEIAFARNGLSRLIITAYGNPKYFRMAEALAKKAPALAGWEVFGLQPPGLFGKALVPLYDTPGIDLTNLWFMPPGAYRCEGKICLDIYAEIYKEETPEMETAIEAAVYDQLGEKTVGLEIARIGLYNLFRLSKENREKLLPIGQLPMYVQHQEFSSLSVNNNGTLQ